MRTLGRVGSAAVCVLIGLAGRGQEPAPQLTDEQLGRVIRDRAVWASNTLGVTDRVPAPWTPLQTDGARVSCWGRTYDHSGALVLRQVASQGAGILAQPVSLVATVAGREVVFADSDPPKVAPAAHRVDVESSSSAAGLVVSTRTNLEYDGCARVELTVTPQAGPVLVEGLELRLAFPAERALYYHWFEATRDPKLTNAGALPEGGLRSHFKPFLWLGDDDRGLCWFCESPKGWQVADRESVLRVERGADAVTMRVVMMDRPHVVAAPWRVTFGLMASPARPLPPGWRDWLVGLNVSNPWTAWQTGFFNNLSGTDDPGTLYPRDPEAMRRQVAAWQEQGPLPPMLPLREPMRVVPYSQIVFWSGKHRDGTPSPELTAFGPEWSNRRQAPGPRPEAPADIPLKDYYWVCPQSSFAQFYLYRLNELADATGIDGIYIDGPWNTCGNPLHGCGYQDDQGNWQVEYKIWAYRDLLKRMYCLFTEKRQNPLIHHHTSCWLCLPCISFSHMLLDGEQYHDAGQKVEDHFLDIVPLDKWRAEHASGRWGPAPFLLPDIPAKYNSTPEATRELLMLTNLHDTAIFPAGNNTREVMRNYQARRLFGVADCEFRGYWGSGDWARCATPQCYVSVYRRADGSRCLLVVGNAAKTEATAAVRPELAALGLSADAGVDLETGEKLPLEAGEMRVALKARDFRLVALPHYEPPPLTAGDLAATAVAEVPNPGFEKGLTGWSTVFLEGNTGTVALDRDTKRTGDASCHLKKVDGPGGVMVQTDDVFRVTPGRKYRADCQVRIANSTGAKSYWMISQLDSLGNPVGTNNLFHGFLTADQDWTPLPFEFVPAENVVAVRLHFLIAFEGVADTWVDDFSLEEVP